MAGYPAQRQRLRVCGLDAPLTFDKANETRGYHAVYRENERNWCPGCGREHWIVGRVTAECAFCGTALPFQEASNVTYPTVIHWKGRRRGALEN